MTEKTSIPPKNNNSPDWLVRGVLTKFGDIFDRLTGRKWQPSSNLATSELIEKLKKLIDSEVRDLGAKGKFVPHNIKLKMQWDKFSTDSEKALKSLESELMSAAVDYINDNHYHTYAPLTLEVKTDYFTEGVKLLTSFEESDDDEREIAVNVPSAKTDQKTPVAAQLAPEIETFIAKFSESEKSVSLAFNGSQRLSVGRTKENALTIDDASVSKVHAALFVNQQKRLTVADTGSTNGTFINDRRIAYGKAYPLENGDKVKFGTVEVVFEYVTKPVEVLADPETIDENSYQVGEFEFKTSRNIKVNEIPEFSEILKPENDNQSSEVKINPEIIREILENQ